MVNVPDRAFPAFAATVTVIGALPAPVVLPAIPTKASLLAAVQ
jgi:hypothetical protein